ncbi:MAG: Mfa1 family fimbria major subunit [Candidatus Phocaeicola faecipullorum]|nr:Mfa1 family fimbria major subunit [Candidatus Phocaeicola faecipullorum]
MKRNALTYLPLLFLLALLVTACKDDTLPASPAEEEEAGSGVYVSVVVNTGGSNASRVPTPGEGGDGPQAGTVEESTVHDLNVFFFQGDDGIDSDANTEITHCLYFSQDNNNLFGGIGQGDYYSATEDVSDKLQIGETYNVLVIANAGDLRNNEELKTLSGLRDYQVSETITNDGYFLMSSESYASRKIKANTPATAEQVSVNIERMTARVDCRVLKKYEVTNSEDKVQITHATLTNKHRVQTYAFKRVTTGISGADLNEVVYLDPEKVSEEKKASNYVIDPYTLTNRDSERTYDIPYFNLETILEESGGTELWNGWKPLTGVDSFSQDEDDYTKLDYTDENVVLNERLTMSNTTGVVFKAKYVPNESSSYALDGTFYIYQGVFYPSLEEIKKQFQLEELTENNYPNYGIKCYDKGICYYTYWIRHANDEDETVFSPMEYAIVRNNIYQLTVKSISRLGSNTPDDSEIDLSLDVVVIRAGEVENEVVFD